MKRAFLKTFQATLTIAFLNVSTLLQATPVIAPLPTGNPSGPAQCTTTPPQITSDGSNVCAALATASACEAAAYLVQYSYSCHCPDRIDRLEQVRRQCQWRRGLNGNTSCGGSSRFDDLLPGCPVSLPVVQ